MAKKRNPSKPQQPKPRASPQRKIQPVSDPARRSLLKAFGGLTAVAVGTYGVVADSFGLKPFMEMAREKIAYGIAIPAVTKVAAQSVLGILRYKTSLVPADSNPIVRPRLEPLVEPVAVKDTSDLLKYFSKATVDASSHLAPLLEDPLTENYAGYDEVASILRANPQEQIIAFGTPTSNSLIRTLMGYREYADPTLGHAHAPNDAIHFPILFELRRRVVLASESQRDVWYQPQPFKQAALPARIPNWGLNVDGEAVLPMTDGNGQLLEDFLVLGAVPNLLHPVAVERALPVTCIGGTHGIGTMALRELLEDELVLPTLQAELRAMGNPSFWQAVLRIELDAPGGKPKSIRLEKRWIRQVEVDRRLLMALATGEALRT